MKTICEIDPVTKAIIGGPATVPDDYPMRPDLMLFEEAKASGFAARQAQSTVPASVPLWKFRAACEQRGILAKITAWIAAQPEPQRIALTAFMEYGTDVHRDSETVEQIAKALGKSDADIDAIFIAANSIDIA